MRETDRNVYFTLIFFKFKHPPPFPTTPDLSFFIYGLPVKLESKLPKDRDFVFMSLIEEHLSQS